ncbi:MAG TPA: PAS domain S-box protein [Casimicrobiaceae bacterium]
MTGREPDPAAPRARSTGFWSAWAPDRLASIFAPIVALLGSAALFFLLAWLYEPFRMNLLIVSAASGTVAGLLAMFRIRREARGREAAARELGRVKIRVGNIVDAAMDPIVTVDEDQRIVGFNAAAEQAFGWPRDALLGQPLDRLLPEHFRAAHRGHVARFGETGVTSRRMGAQAVLRALRRNGEEFPIEASISQHVEDGRKFYTVILRDVGERLRAEALLARSEARLRGILDSAMDAIITVDADQRVVLFNNAAETMFGWPRAEAIGAPLGSFVPQRYRADHAAHVARFGATGVTSRRMGGSLRVVTGLRRNGEEFPIDASISQITEGGARLYTVILRDITARLAAEEALRRSRDELQELGAVAHLTREQEKSRIARELHDELGQLLTMLQMDVAWCREKRPPGSDAFAAKLDRMEALLKSTIAATRRIAADLRPLMLDDLGLVPSIEWLVENFSQRTGIACELTIASRELQVPKAHADAIFRIVQESLTNIAKHARASHADIVIENDGDAFVVRVEDDGVGFSPLAPRKPQSLGLYGLRERASLLGGEATIASAPGEGTIVEVRLPRTAPAAAS